MDITTLTALELSKEIRVGNISVLEATRAQLEKIKQEDKKYNCYITILEEEALQRAKEVQLLIDAGELRNQSLAGVPFAVKDNICTKGVRTTCSSKILENFIPPYHATVIDKLNAAGAVMIGKVNMDEFGMGSTTETSYFGSTKNPWNIDYVPGGSSGGSAAAVAANEAYFALASDTGGSIRQPSSFCGVTGIKPTYGLVSRYGLVAYASSFDQIGPIGKNVSDCAAILEVLAGHDDKDSTSVDQKKFTYTESLKDDIRGMRIGIPKNYMEKGLDEEVKSNILSAVEVLKDKGAIVEIFDMDILDYAIPAYYVIASAQASSNLSRYDGIKYGYRSEEFQGLEDLYKKSRSEGFGMEAKRRMMIGAFVLNSGYYDDYYIKALKIQSLIKDSFNQAFEKYDIILGPTTPSTANKLGESLSDPLQMYLGDLYTVAVNLAGLPAISLPCGCDKKGLPIGLQLIGKHFAEKEIIRVAYSYEQAREYERLTI